MVTVYKIGGNVIDDAEALKAFLAEFAAAPSPKVLVHGGGKEASRMSRAMGVEPQMVNGRRITDADTIRIVTMVYAGLVNKRVVAGLQALGCNAIGLSGADGNAIKATRRPAKPVDYGFVGDISPEGVNAPFIGGLVEGGLVPVFCAINHDGNGTLLNCNADSVASAIAKGLAAAGYDVNLVFCFEQPGVLADIDDKSSVISVITPDSYPALRESGTVSGGMIPKVENALDAVASEVRSVAIRSSQNINEPSGTVVCR